MRGSTAPSASWRRLARAAAAYSSRARRRPSISATASVRSRSKRRARTSRNASRTSAALKSPTCWLVFFPTSFQNWDSVEVHRGDRHLVLPAVGPRVEALRGGDERAQLERLRLLLQLGRQRL